MKKKISCRQQDPLRGALSQRALTATTTTTTTTTNPIKLAYEQRRPDGRLRSGQRF